MASIRSSSILLTAATSLATLSGCASPPTQAVASTSDEATEGYPQPPKLIQAGTNLVALGVTSDDRAIYWDAGSVYATALKPGAPRQLVATASQPPLTMVVGRVVLVWTAQPYVNPAAPSPLVVWTSKDGPREVSKASLPPSLSAIFTPTAVSPNGREVIFTTNVSADGATGDVVRARVDGSATTKLVEGADVNPFGACPPHAGFNRGGEAPSRTFGDERGEADDAIEQRSSRGGGKLLTLVAACPAGSTTATLAEWTENVRVELSNDLLPFGWTTDEDGRRLFATLSSRTPVVFDLKSGASAAVEATPSASLGWMNPDGTVFSRTAAGDAQELHRTAAKAPRTNVVVSLTPGASGFVGFGFPNHLPQGVPHYNVSTVPTSPDGRLAFAFTELDPNTGLTDFLLVDTAKTNQTPLRFEESIGAFPSFELATSDSSHLLYYAVNPAVGVTGDLIAARRDGARRPITTTGSSLLASDFALGGAKVVYSDGAADVAAGLFATTDINVVDLGDEQLSPVRVAAGARALYFPTSRRRAVVYTSDAGPSAQGLFVVRMR